MINLLPEPKKRVLIAARSNSVLLAYNFWLLAGLGVIVLAFGAVYAILGIGQKTAEDNIAANQAKVASYADVRKQGQEFSQNLTIAKNIFANQIDYSNLLVQIAKTFPSGSSLQNLTLDSTTLGASTQLSVNVTSPQKALAVKDALNGNEKIFSNAYIQSITAQETDGYPYVATITVTINKEAVSQ